MNLLVLDQLIREFNAGVNIFNGNGRVVIVRDDLLGADTSRQKIKDEIDHHSVSFDAGLTMAYLWIYGNAFKKILHGVLLFSISSIVDGIKRVKGIVVFALVSSGDPAALGEKNHPSMLRKALSLRSEGAHV
jgi:hypothetical protein